MGYSQTPYSQQPSFIGKNISIASIVDKGVVECLIMIEMMEFLKKAGYDICLDLILILYLILNYHVQFLI